MPGTAARRWTGRRIPLDIAGLIIFCAILSLLIDRSLAQSPVPLSVWLVLAMGDVVEIYLPFLLMAWALFRIWDRFGLREAHGIAVLATLLLNLLGRVLLAYSIASGFSNA